MGENSSGFTNEQSLQDGAFSRDLLDRKSKSPLFPGAVGPWLQITSALVVAGLYVVVRFVLIFLSAPFPCCKFLEYSGIQ